MYLYVFVSFCPLMIWQNVYVSACIQCSKDRLCTLNNPHNFPLIPSNSHGKVSPECSLNTTSNRSVGCREQHREQGAKLMSRNKTNAFRYKYTCKHKNCICGTAWRSWNQCYMFHLIKSQSNVISLCNRGEKHKYIHTVPGKRTFFKNN